MRTNVLQQAEVEASPGGVSSAHRRMTAPKYSNPFVRAILRSRFHGLLSSYLMLITVRGRKTGRVHTFPVGYVEDGEALYVLVGEYERKTWWRNFEGGRPVQLRLRGRTIEATGKFLRWESDAEVLVEALCRYVARFRSSGRHLGITFGPSGADEDSVRKAAREVVMVRVSLARKDGIDQSHPELSR